MLVYKIVLIAIRGGSHIIQLVQVGGVEIKNGLFCGQGKI
jgi:hypothetical protein